jgi:regulator of sigma D
MSKATTEVTMGDTNMETTLPKSVDLKEAAGAWLQMQERINSWLLARQKLILMFCSVDGLRNLNPGDAALTQKLNHMCQILIDYVTAGHFDIYSNLVTNSEHFTLEEFRNTDCSNGEINQDIKVIFTGIQMIDQGNFSGKGLNT